MDMRRDTVLPLQKRTCRVAFCCPFLSEASPVPSGRPVTIVTRSGDVRDMGMRSKGIRIRPYLRAILD